MGCSCLLILGYRHCCRGCQPLPDGVVVALSEDVIEVTKVLVFLFVVEEFVKNFARLTKLVAHFTLIIVIFFWRLRLRLLLLRLLVIFKFQKFFQRSCWLRLLLTIIMVRMLLLLLLLIVILGSR